MQDVTDRADGRDQGGGHQVSRNASDAGQVARFVFNGGTGGGDRSKKPYGWVFFYNTVEFLETGNRLATLGGNAPIMVEKATGQIFVTGTAKPLDHYLADYERFHPHRL